MKMPCRVFLLGASLSCSFPWSFAATTSAEVSNFALIDQRGKLHELRRVQGSAVVLYFTMNGCPVARQSASKLNALRDRYSERGIDIVMINSSAGDDRSSIAKEMRELAPQPRESRSEKNRALGRSVVRRDVSRVV